MQRPSLSQLLEDIFLANGCDFVSMSEDFDTSTPLGHAMIGIQPGAKAPAQPYENRRLEAGPVQASHAPRRPALL